MAQKINFDYISDTLSFWRKLTDAQKNQLGQSIAIKKFASGEAMHSNSEQCSGLFLLVSGQVRAYIISEGGKEITLYRLFDRDVCIFSAACMIRNIAFDVFVEVEKDTTAYLIPTAAFMKLSKESIEVQSFTNELMASRFSEVMWIMEQALFVSFDKRLANFLVEQANIEESDVIKITHEKLANHLGTAREVVTRMLKYFQTEGMVSLNRGAIVIINRRKLEEIAG